MSSDERAIPTELRDDARKIVQRIEGDNEAGRPVHPGRLWAAADALRDIVHRLDDPKQAA